MKFLVGASLVYANIALIISPQPLRPRWLPAPPLPGPVHDLFLLPGMFSGYDSRNIDFVIEASHLGQWRELPLKDHFPDRLGVTFAQFMAVRHWDMLGQPERDRVIAGRAPLIAARHRRLHPKQPIDRLRLSIDRWPKHSAGYRVAKKSPWVRRTVLWEGPVP